MTGSVGAMPKSHNTCRQIVISAVVELPTQSDNSDLHLFSNVHVGL